MPDPYVLVPAGAFAEVGAGDVVGLSADAAHHLTRVLRLHDGQPVVAADGDGVVATARLAGHDLRLTGAPVVVPPPTPMVTVWQALGKGRKHDEVVRVLTELGVDRIVAVATDRTVVDLEGKADRVRSRWQAVAVAACEQARRPHLPAIEGPVRLEHVLASVGGTPCLVAHVGVATDPLVAAAAVRGAEEVVVAIGPEGGWADEEVAALVGLGAVPVGLGPTVLRTEHAGTVLASIVLAAVGRLSD